MCVATSFTADRAGAADGTGGAFELAEAVRAPSGRSTSRPASPARPSSPSCPRRRIEPAGDRLEQGGPVAYVCEYRTRPTSEGGHARSALGANSRVVLDFETAWGTAKGSPDGKSVAFRSPPSGAAQELIDNPALREDLNPIDPFGKKSASGSLVIVPTLAVMPFLCEVDHGRACFPRRAPRTRSRLKAQRHDARRHVVETKIDVGGTLRYVKGVGVRVNRLSIYVSFGLNTISLDVLAKSGGDDRVRFDAPLDWASGAPLDNMSLKTT